MTDYDPEVEIIKAKKLREMKKKMMKEREQKSDREVLLDYLVERGDEVFYAAEAQYPREMAALTKKFAELIRSGSLQGKISGTDLYSLLRSVGLRVRMDTKIQFEEHGKLVSLSERLKLEE